MTFDYPGYELRPVQVRRCKDGSAHLFTAIYKFYSPVTRQHYILHADYHAGDVFAIKFYCKKDRHSSFKYAKIVNLGDAGNILITCLKAIPLLLESYPTASFCFASSRSYDAVSRKLESHINNQRFRTYRYIVALKIGTATFAHFAYPQVSGYLLVNRQSTTDILAKERSLVAMLQATYNDLHDIP